LPPPLASVLRDRGWRTAYLNNCDLDWGDQRMLLEGCQSYDAMLDFRDMDCALLTSAAVEDRCLIDRLLQWIDEKPGQPFLAVCWTDQTHDPYPTSPGVPLIDFFQGKPPARHAADLSRYLNVLRETDRHLGRLFNALRKRGLADDTVVAITGDHGEAFSDPHDQRSHGWTLYQEDVNVPLMLWNPKLFAPGRHVADVGAHVDLNPTIADLLGIEPHGGWQGHSLFDPARPPRSFFMTNIREDKFGVRESDWKYVLNTTAGWEMLFNLARDPEEQHNVADAEPERCRRLRQRIAAWVSFEEEFLRGRTN
jgi:arylsulfatase A-like enzyme